MPKAALKRSEMKALKEAGVPAEAIAEKAGGIHPAYVQFCSQVDDYEKFKTQARERYQNLDPDEQNKYRSTSCNWQREQQQKSLEFATKSGRWEQKEIEFVKKFGPTMTTLQVAITLGRTYRSVRHAVKQYDVSMRMGA